MSWFFIIWIVGLAPFKTQAHTAYWRPYFGSRISIFKEHLNWGSVLGRQLCFGFPSNILFRTLNLFQPCIVCQVEFWILQNLSAKYPRIGLNLITQCSLGFWAPAILNPCGVRKSNLHDLSPDQESPGLSHRALGMLARGQLRLGRIHERLEVFHHLARANRASDHLMKLRQLSWLANDYTIKFGLWLRSMGGMRRLTSLYYHGSNAN